MSDHTGRLPRQYQITILARTSLEQAWIDRVLEDLASRGVYIHSGGERSTSTGQALEDYSPVLLEAWAKNRGA